MDALILMSKIIEYIRAPPASLCAKVMNQPATSSTAAQYAVYVIEPTTARLFNDMVARVS
ncbi:MAG: hypothetical protein ACLR0N_09620 [Bilophila wadsworthia]